MSFESSRAGLRLPSRRSALAVVPMSQVDDTARDALSTALTMSAGRVMALHVCVSPQDSQAFTAAWEQWEPGVPLVLLERVPSSGDRVAASIADYLRRRHTAYQVFVVTTASLAIDAALLTLPNIVVCHGAQTGAQTGARA